MLCALVGARGLPASARNDLDATVLPWLRSDATAKYPLVSFASDARDAIVDALHSASQRSGRGP